jgi:zinc transport system substrate-binding protein
MRFLQRMILTGSIPGNGGMAMGILKKAAAGITVFLFFTSAVFAADQAKKMEVVTTLFPLYDFARQVGGDKVNVSLILPPGVEPHTFEPKPADIVRISKAGVFIYTGKYMEPWVEEMVRGINAKGLLVVDASRGIKLMEEKEEEEEHEEHGHENEHHHGGKDPHIWLDLANDQVIVDTIAEAFAEKDPARREFYLKNAGRYKTELAGLDRRFKETLATAKSRKIIYGGHFAFGYFVKRYGLDYDSPYEGFSPNAEPSPKAIAGLIDKLNQSGIKYIYYEELLDPKVARTISRETGARLELLHGAHNVSRQEFASGVTFIKIMEDNLEKLKTGLDCR